MNAAHESNQNKGSIYMVFEYMDHDLTGLADRPGMRFTAPQVCSTNSRTAHARPLSLSLFARCSTQG